MTLGIFSVWFLLAIFLRFRWGSAVLTCVFFPLSEALRQRLSKLETLALVASNPAAVRLFWMYLL